LWIVLLVTASQASAQNEIELLIFNLGTGMLNSNSSSKASILSFISLFRYCA